jgi:hypothetical protein
VLFLLKKKEIFKILQLEMNWIYSSTCDTPTKLQTACFHSCLLPTTVFLKLELPCRGNELINPHNSWRGKQVALLFSSFQEEN